MFADLYIEFFVRLVIKFARRLGTNHWRVLNAIVVSSEQKLSFTGCRLVVIHCRYRNANERFEGTFKQPFIFENYANAYLRRYPGGSEFPVLISPKNSSCAIPAEGKIAFERIEVVSNGGRLDL